MTVPLTAATGAYTLTKSHSVWTFKPGTYIQQVDTTTATYKFIVVKLNMSGTGLAVSGAAPNPMPFPMPVPTPSVMVGQQVTLNASVAGISGITPAPTVTYQWTVGGEKVKSYTQSQYDPFQIDPYGTTGGPKGEKTDLPATDLTKADPSFYFTNGDFTGTTVAVSCTATVSGKTLTDTGSIKVFRPQVDSFTGTWTTANPPIDVRYGRFIIGDANIPGITWDAKVTMPTKPPSVLGSIFYTQRIKYTRKWRAYNTTTWMGGTSSDVYVLDDGEGIQYGGSVSVSSGDVGKLLSRPDSPNSTLTNTDEAFSTNDSFELYLMYQPNGGIPVTLSKLTWNWSGYASLLGGTWTNNAGVWTNSRGIWTKTAGVFAPASPLGSNYAVQPLWQDSLKAIQNRGDVAIP